MMTVIRQSSTESLAGLCIERLQQERKDEIERAINGVKHPRTAWDKWFRKEWHRAKWRRIRGWSRAARKRASRLQEG